jgi:hypothetical protein
VTPTRGDSGASRGPASSCGASAQPADHCALICLAALSSSLIAFTFIDQMCELGVAFSAFVLIVLPVLAFLGVPTFLHLVQSFIEDPRMLSTDCPSPQPLPELKPQSSFHNRNNGEGHEGTEIER